MIAYDCRHDLEGELVTDARFWHVVEQGGATYVWTDGPDTPTLYALSKDEAWQQPASCRFASGGANTDAQPEDCALPVYPDIGKAVGAGFAGLWVSCDTPNATAPGDCDVDFAGASPPGNPRWALYIDARGFGQKLRVDGSAYAAQPTACNAAFRLATRQLVLQPGDPPVDVALGFVIQSDIPFGDVTMGPDSFQEVATVTTGTGTAPGKYLVSNNGGTFDYKQVPLPSGFVDPCAGVEPPFTW